MGQIKTAVATRDDKPAELSPKQILTNVLDTNAGAVGASLPSGYNQDRFMRLLLTAANTNPDLFNCDPRSFLAAGVTAAQLGLEPNDPRGLAYLIPFNERTKTDKGDWITVRKVQLIIGYKGMLDLARRSGMVSTINAFPVFKGDQFEYALGLEPTLRHVPGDHDEDPADLTHVYAVAKVNGEPQFAVMTRRQIEKIMASSKGAASNRSPWTTHFTEMALKSVLRRLCKWLPQTVEMAKADSTDDKSLRFGTDMLITTDEGDQINPATGEIVNRDADEADVIDADSAENGEQLPGTAG